MWTYLIIIYRMSKYCLLISSIRLNNILCTFCLRRNNESEWFVETKEVIICVLSTVWRMLSYIMNLLLFCHYMLWMIKILPWRPQRNMWFRRSSESVNTRNTTLVKMTVSTILWTCQPSFRDYGRRWINNTKNI